MSQEVERLIQCALLGLILYKGIWWYVDYKMMNDAMDKIAFLEKNNASQSDICGAIDLALITAENHKNQEKYTELKAKSKQLYCSE